MVLLSRLNESICVKCSALFLIHSKASLKVPGHSPSWCGSVD